MTYDLHVHSCLSPCADDSITPADIAGFAKLNGIELLAVTDHNAAENLPAVQQACHAYGVRLLPGIEVNTAEEIHLLTYFSTIEAALEMSELLYRSLPDVPYDSSIWGNQLVMDADDTVILRREKLLTAASSYDIYRVTELCCKMGGIAIPAHVDRDSYSLLSVLGFAPEDIPFEAYEVTRPEHVLQDLWDNGRLPDGCSVLTSSDAHRLEDIAMHPRVLPENSPLWRLLL